MIMRECPFISEVGAYVDKQLYCQTALIYIFKQQFRQFIFQ